MADRFRSRCTSDAVEVTLHRSGWLGGDKILPPDAWTTLTGANAPAARRLLPLVAEGGARWDGDALVISNDVAAGFTGMLASRIGLPEIAPLLVDIAFHRTIGDPESRIETSWMEAAHLPISPRRTGLEITWGERTNRLSGPLFVLMEAIDRFNATAPDDLPTKTRRWGEVTTALSTVKGETVSTDAYTKGLTVFQAGSFALDVTHGIGDVDFWPILMSRTVARSLEDNAPVTEEGGDEPDELVDAEVANLLVAEDRKAFQKAFENAGDGVRLSYNFRRNSYILIDPDLRRALDVVRAMRTAPEERKRAFVKNPRTVIATELGLDTEDPSLSSIFVETRQYSDRVIGLGVWQRPELTWLSKANTEWLPERFPVELDGKRIEVARAEVVKLRDDVIAAEEAHVERVPFQGGEIPIPAAESVLTQVGLDIKARLPVDAETGQFVAESDAAQPMVAQPSEPVVVQIETNFEEVTFEVLRRPRVAVIPLGAPAARMGSTTFKRHQQEGFDWLVGSWVAGWPGVLLADDMGLGKTFQGLAFLAWITENKRAALARGNTAVNKGPILIVAPTALLQNWIQEAARHLAPDALGRNLAEVFGGGIRRFRNPDDAARALGETLDWRKLADHDWVLTTYETLADNHASFARVNFSVALFDEMQKVKDPGTLNTWAAKTVNADFVLGLTGTPIENRIEDLWCIMDRVFPGFLRDLRSFSRDYRDGDRDRYRALSEQMKQPVDGAPAIMLRRMKEDELEGLPEKRIETYPTPMPTVQAEAYGRIVAGALEGDGARARGAMLEVIQNLRGISLYPGDPTDVDLSTERGCNAWIERSARLGRSFEILRGLERSREKGLIFVEQRGMQALLAEAMTTMFGMDRPLIINGDTPGGRRQAMVDEFQGRRRGFDVMILSPKAAGVGLTITAANHVLHLSRWWNPAVEDQCNDRVYRIGQDKPVTIHIPMAVHPTLGDRTFDVTLHQLLQRKRTMSRDLLMPPVSDADLTDVFNLSMAA